jgi:uncharacterized protein (TIGR02996 family)
MTRADVERERRQLLDAVLGAPDDDGPRLVYSDWLQQHDDPRGEFIAIQCELPRASGERLRALRLRELELLRKHRLVWIGRLFGGQWRACRFERGFVVHAVLRVREITTLGERILAEEPLRSVHLMDADVADVGRCAPLRQFRALGAFDLSVGDRGLRELAAAKTLCGLERLELVRCGISTLGVSAFASATLPCLSSLSLAGNHLGDEGAATLARSPILATVRDLHLGRNLIGVKGARALASSPHLENVERLRVWMNPIGRLGLAALTERFGARVEADAA